jgi:hypothetical protein
MANYNYSVIHYVYINGMMAGQSIERFDTLSEVLSYLSKEALRSDDVDLFGDFDGQVHLDVGFGKRERFERYEIHAFYEEEEP